MKRVCLLGMLLACNTTALRPVAVLEVSLPQVTHAQVEHAIPTTVKDRAGWAQDVLEVMEELRLGRAPQSVCMVMAIIEQESGFEPNPVVPGLAKVIDQRLEEYRSKLGPLGRPALGALLGGRAPGQKHTFEQRLARVKTERDVDLIFRDLLAHYEEMYPRASAALDALGGLFNRGHLEDLNPVTTVGSMQVSVRFAAELGRQRGLTTTTVRDQLYTRRGGVLYGTARLLGYDAAYLDPMYRFADYNSGVYASRNAALQEQVKELTGFQIALDGDWWAYDRNGHPHSAPTQSFKAAQIWRSRFAPELGDAQLRQDLLGEKTAAFEETVTYRAVRRTYSQATGRAPAYSRMPKVTLQSPKMSHNRTTAWYAKNVNARYVGCLRRLGAPGSPVANG